MKPTIFLSFALLTTAIDLPPLPDWYDRSKLPPGFPGEAPEYMVDNTGNTFGVAPDKGTLDKPVTEPEQQFLLMSMNNQSDASVSGSNSTLERRQNSGYWYESIKHGDMPFAPGGYQMFRNVKDFGAKGDGSSDDTAAINRAASWLSRANNNERCGRECGQTTILGAVVYFPSGIYLISSPIIQYYFTQFVGDVNARPTIRGSANFTGMALIDCDPYIPGGNGANWYINQNQFFRQIRNFIFDLKEMPWWGQDGDQFYAPTGIHWQVSQAASLQNLDFQMPLSDSRGSTNATGIFMENGSGGFLSDLYFFGGGIGFRAGSQQYTARNLKFELTLTAISMIWDWGFTWQNIEVNACWVAIEAKSVGGLYSQGSASITVLDSYFRSVPYPIVLRNGGPHPNIILDNVRVEASASVVLIDGGDTILPGSQGLLYYNSWGMGKRYTSQSGNGEVVTGFIDPPPQKPPSLLDGSGNIFARSKPTYGNLGAGSFVVATDTCNNKGEGDQSDNINRLLANNVGKPIYFPSGVYLVEKTIEVPVNSIIVGELWPQIMGTGDFFSDENNPQVMIRVGKSGDSGIVEISDMLFSVKGPTRGAIMMEWNVHESTQGSAAMWDSHFRVGGGYFSDLTIEECPKSTSDPDRNCMAALLLLHITPTSSGYFENVWVWTADHDMDVEVPGGVETTTSAQINIYTARGTLIESEGPCWFYGTGSEHHQIYQYQLNNARNIFMTHIQTETPYYQPTPDATKPYAVGAFSGDPDFSECESESTCAMAWGLRVISSRDIMIYTAGMYSFFFSYDQVCLADEHCQDNMVETSYTEGFWFYNIFTKGVAQMITPRGGIPALLAEDNQAGFTTEVSAWLALGLSGGDLGGDQGSPQDGSGAAYIDPIIFVSPSPTIQCWAPCTLVIPPSPLAEPTVLSFAPVDTSLVVGGSTITTIVVPTITVSIISFSNIVIPASETSDTFALQSSIKVPPILVTGGGGTVSTITLPAFETASQTSTISVAVLPTTVTQIDGVRWTFSMDQFTDLRSITGTTTLTSTTLRDEPKASSTSSTTIFPFILVAPGGFYWSPVYPPGPTPPLLPKLPRLPSFPPVPNPPCFKLFGIFSINCPPDKQQPTTHFTRGPVKVCHPPQLKFKDLLPLTHR
ncbi:putative glucan 1,3-beta-glucosidase precursor [Cadophora sp. MPI-SDFR-AT-0126]|nr:putative glucan 1,3-beta-glucosidase precursor [Leotiomycetes sp. MPI-SDFR-AT-0126]